MSYDFKQTVVYISGGASGLGEATAKRFARAGASVVIADIALRSAERVASQLEDALAVEVDTSNYESVRKSFAIAVEKYGRVDVIFNNAGITGEQQKLHEMDLSNWRKVTGINGDGAFFVLKEGIATLLKGKGGVVINTASTVGLAAFADLSHYTYAKAGLIGLTRSAAIEYANHNIRVNAVAPTMVMTPLVEQFLNQAADPLAARAQAMMLNPKHGMPTPDDVAGVVMFLASSDAQWITGHTIPIDGGYIAK